MAVIKLFNKSTLVFMLVLSAVGCGSSSNSSSSGGGASMDDMAAQLDAQEAARQKEQARLDAEKKAQEEAAAVAAANQEPERKVAGRSKVGEGGYYTAIIGARRHILNEAESWAWKQAVKHFRAKEGRMPKDHEEFMNKVVMPLEIDLGYIEENQEFLYDPAAESDDGLGVLYVVEKEPVPETEPEQK
jgi:hypothetical protein